jgi:hypothetical protein
MYAVRAVAASRNGGPAAVDRERAWQLERAPETVRTLLRQQA